MIAWKAIIFITCEIIINNLTQRLSVLSVRKIPFKKRGNQLDSYLFSTGYWIIRS